MIFQIYLAGGRELTIPKTTPWFTKWRTTFLQIQNVSDHEYTRHFLGCILFKIVFYHIKLYIKKKQFSLLL